MLAPVWRHGGSRCRQRISCSTSSGCGIRGRGGRSWPCVIRDERHEVLRGTEHVRALNPSFLVLRERVVVVKDKKRLFDYIHSTSCRHVPHGVAEVADDAAAPPEVRAGRSWPCRVCLTYEPTCSRISVAHRWRKSEGRHAPVRGSPTRHWLPVSRQWFPLRLSASGSLPRNPYCRDRLTSGDPPLGLNRRPRRTGDLLRHREPAHPRMQLSLRSAYWGRRCAVHGGGCIR